MVWLTMVSAFAIAGGGETAADTGGGTTGIGSDTGDVPVNDTVCSVNPCSTASELAKEKGGSPCSDGCDSSGGALPGMALLILSGWGIRRRQIRSTPR